VDGSLGAALSAPSEQMPAAALVGNDIGLLSSASTDLTVTSQRSPLYQEEPIAVAQERALAKFGQFVAYEGRTIEILRPGDPRLAMVRTVQVGYFQIADPEQMRRIGFSPDMTLRFSDEDILNPPSQRPVERMGGDGPAFIDPFKLPAYWSDPNSPVIGDPNLDYDPIQRPLLPGEGWASPDLAITIGPRDLAAEAEFLARLGLRNNPDRVWTEQELREAAQLFGFPSQDGIVGIADFNQDGQRDLLLRNGVTGELQIWYMNSGNKIGEAPIVNYAATPGTNWVVEGVGDFNNDQSPDLVWRDLGSSGSTVIWFMNNNNFVAGQTVGTGNVANLPANWRIVGVTEF
jgi:FG-GAP-like repeat